MADQCKMLFGGWGNSVQVDVGEESVMHVRIESHAAAVGSSGVSRALISGKMHVNRGDVLLHHLPLDLKFLAAALQLHFFWNLCGLFNSECIAQVYFRARSLDPAGCWVCGLCLGSAFWWLQELGQSSLRQGHVRCPLQLTSKRKTVLVTEQHPPWPRPSNILGKIF